MKEEFPFRPKSNAKLRPGHFWPVKLDNGRYACGIVLDVPLEKENYNSRNFYVGLLNWTGTEKPTTQLLESSTLKVMRHGRAHIKTITVQGEAIEGQIDLAGNNLEIALTVDSASYSPGSNVFQGFKVIRKATPEDHNALDTNVTWGYEFILALANLLLKS